MILFYWILALVLVVVVAPVSVVESRFMWLVLAIVVFGIIRHCVKLTKQLLGYISRSDSARRMSGTMFLSCGCLFKKVTKLDDAIWIGTGFRWTGDHSGKLYEHLYCTRKKTDIFSGSHHVSKNNLAYAGAINYLQGLNGTCYDLRVPIEQFKGHTLLVATTRAIKTRFLSLLAVQALFRSPKETIIVIDPKGDLELKRLLEQQSTAHGRKQDFIFFHPAFPEQSISINPLQNFSRATEVASRLVDVMSRGEKEDAFTAFAWRAVNVISNGIIFLGDTPDIVTIKQYVDKGVGGLLKRVLEKYLQQNLSESRRQEELKCANNKFAQQKDQESLINQFLFEDEEFSSKRRENTLHTLMQNYILLQKEGRGDTSIDDLLSFYRHDRNHASKMMASLTPLLSQLSSGVLKNLLSPSNTGDQGNQNFATIIEQHKIIYIGLDSMTDPVVGEAIGQILLADLAAVAAQRYNYSQDFSRVNLFIDEAHSICNKSLLTLANQGAGAGIELYLASQTLSDFVVALGSEEHALKLLGNLNNLICGRTIDPWTQKLITERFGKTHIEQLMRAKSESSGTGSGLLDWSSSWGERMSMVETDLVPASILGRIPNLEYFALLANGSLIKGKIPVLEVS